MAKERGSNPLEPVLGDAVSLCLDGAVSERDQRDAQAASKGGREWAYATAVVFGSGGGVQGAYVGSLAEQRKAAIVGAGESRVGEVPRGVGALTVVRERVQPHFGCEVDLADQESSIGRPELKLHVHAAFRDRVSRVDRQVD